MILLDNLINSQSKKLQTTLIKSTVLLKINQENVCSLLCYVQIVLQYYVNYLFKNNQSDSENYVLVQRVFSPDIPKCIRIVSTASFCMTITLLCLIVGESGISREVDIFLDFHKVEG